MSYWRLPKTLWRTKNWGAIAIQEVTSIIDFGRETISATKRQISDLHHIHCEGNVERSAPVFGYILVAKNDQSLWSFKEAGTLIEVQHDENKILSTRQKIVGCKRKTDQLWGSIPVLEEQVAASLEKASINTRAGGGSATTDGFLEFQYFRVFFGHESPGVGEVRFRFFLSWSYYLQDSHIFGSFLF